MRHLQLAAQSSWADLFAANCPICTVNPPHFPCIRRLRVGHSIAVIEQATAIAPTIADALEQVRQNPRDHRAYQQLSAAYAKDRQADDLAIAAALQAIALEPKVPEPDWQAECGALWLACLSQSCTFGIFMFVETISFVDQNPN